MSTSNNQTAVKTLSDVTITKCNPINETGSYVISFSDGSVLQGGMPYSYLGLYTYDVEYTKMTYANSVITKITPKKKPLNFVSLVALMRASLGEETSTADILSEAEFDKSFNAPDQSEKFKTLFPVLYEKLEKTMEGLKYFHFESISVLATTYGMGTLHLLKEEKIKMLIATLKLKPCHFMFECMIPDHRIRELSLDEYTAMAKLMGHTVQMEERVAESIYRTILKKDLSNGNTTSTLNKVRDHALYEHGLELLKREGIVQVEDVRFVTLRSVVLDEEGLRRAFETIKKRFEENNGLAPLRDPATDPYHQELKPLCAEQEKALERISSGPVGILSGGAGTGKCLGANVMIPLYNGTIKCAKDIQIGDVLIGDDSKPRRVLSIASGEEEMFRITPSSGLSFECNRSHMLTLLQKHPEATGEAPSTSIIDISLDEWLKSSDEFKQQTALFYTPVELEYTSLPVPSSVLGEFLSGKTSMTKEQLEALGKDFDKERIPKQYLASARVHRLYLLTGLIDDLNDENRERGTVELRLPSKKMLPDLIFLIRSLGFNYTHITGDVLRLDRPSRDYDEQPIELSFSYESLGNGNYYGFTLDGNGRFRLLDCVVTHNTTILARLASKYSSGTIACCGPTNRAARILTKKVIISHTMHKFANDVVSDSGHPEKVRILIIDEGSMIPLHLLAVFMKILVLKLPNLQQVIFVGDIEQIPSVEAGAVLYDLTQAFKSTTSILLENHRTDPSAKKIYENAMKIRSKQTNLVVDPDCFTFFPPSGNLFSDFKRICDTYKELKPWNSHIISPYRNETETMNNVAKQIYKGQSGNNTFYVGDKIMSTTNNSKEDLINGDFFEIRAISIITTERFRDSKGNWTEKEKHNPAQNTGQRLGRNERYAFTVIPASFTEEENKKEDAVEKLIDTKNVRLSDFVHGYCTTNHQFQGGEADIIIFVVLKASYFINYKQLYTAVTRAKKRVIILGTQQEFTKCIEYKYYPRRTLLFDHLKKENTFVTAFWPLDVEEDPKELMELIGIKDKDNGEESNGTKRSRDNEGNNEAQKRPKNNFGGFSNGNSNGNKRPSEDGGNNTSQFKRSRNE